MIFTSTKYYYLYLLRKVIEIYSSVKADRIKIYTHRLSISQNLDRLKKIRLYEFTMISGSNSRWTGLACLFLLTYLCTLTVMKLFYLHLWIMYYFKKRCKINIYNKILFLVTYAGYKCNNHCKKFKWHVNTNFVFFGNVTIFISHMNH